MSLLTVDTLSTYANVVSTNKVTGAEVPAVHEPPKTEDLGIKAAQARQEEIAKNMSAGNSQIGGATGTGDSRGEVLLNPTPVKTPRSVPYSVGG